MKKIFEKVRLFISLILYRLAYFVDVPVEDDGTFRDLVDTRPRFTVQCPECAVCLPIPLDGEMFLNSENELCLNIEPEFDALHVHTWTHQEGVQTSAE
jgi:hypothetical protein